VLPPERAAGVTPPIKRERTAMPVMPFLIHQVGSPILQSQRRAGAREGRGIHPLVVTRDAQADGQTPREAPRALANVRSEPTRRRIPTQWAIPSRERVITAFRRLQAAYPRGG